MACIIRIFLVIPLQMLVAFKIPEMKCPIIIDGIVVMHDVRFACQPRQNIPYQHSLLCHIPVMRIYVFVNHFTVMIQLIEHAVRNILIQLIPDQVLHGSPGFILIRPVIHLGDAFLYFLQQVNCQFLDLFDVSL